MRGSIKAVIARLEEIQKSVESYQATAAVNNDERESTLQDELDAIECAIEALNEIE